MRTDDFCSTGYEVLLSRLEASVSKWQQALDIQKREKSRIKRVSKYIEQGSAPYILRTVHKYLPWLPISSVSVTLFTGQRLSLPFADRRSHELNRYGIEPTDCEIRLARHYIRSLNSNSLLFDIGANYGYFSAIGTSRGARICAFEANDKLCAYLKKNFEGKPVEIVDALVAREHGMKAEFFVVDGNEDRSTMHADVASELVRERMSVHKEECNTISIDKYVEETGHVPTHVKIDVEGGEYEVLQGMERTLRTEGPEIVLEIWGGAKFEISQAAANLLELHGYRPFIIGMTEDELTTLNTVSSMSESRDNILFRK